MNKLNGKRSKRIRFIRFRPKVSIKKMYWEFHKGDEDYNPSVPHGHALDGKYKLELWSGKIYEIATGEVYAVAKAKDMRKLYVYDGFQEFVDMCRNTYIEHHPGFILPDLTPNKGFSVAKQKRLRKYSRGMKVEGYVFATEYD